MRGASRGNRPLSKPQQRNPICGFWRCVYKTSVSLIVQHRFDPGLMSKSCNALRSTITALRQIRNMSNFMPASRVQGAKPSIWVEFTTLARECEAVNLGQVFFILSYDYSYLEPCFTIDSNVISSIQGML
ncbi:hypothetical protein TELCIR_00987 [Teladorsagia circumcincta]|uniref:Uncharacterized protein n=1 Tax=Teladorsagia circumcincta TaxID=45464 RepID=A0A2G9V384_TELCI|nr:hypothetical protein TELCIR_00987 [Teladorsagia circumcincta]